MDVSRGAIVDPDALIERAKRGDIRVGLDVFDPEPIPEDSEIRTLPNVFIMPRNASFSAACGPLFSTFLVEELEHLFGGDETIHDITPRVLANRRGTAVVSRVTSKRTRARAARERSAIYLGVYDRV